MDATTKTKTRCETVDQILPWTDPAGRLNIEVGDLVLDGGGFKQIGYVELGKGSNLVWYSFVGESDVASFVGADELIGVRRYLETTEE